jgi:hypothetical protein
VGDVVTTTEEVADSAPDESQSTQSAVTSNRHRTLSVRDVGVKSRFRYATALFAILGTLAGLLTLVAPAFRTLLVAFAGIGLFGALLLWTVTRDRFLSLSTAEAICEPLLRNQTVLTDSLELDGQPWYVPMSDGDVRLVVPSSDPDDQEEVREMATLGVGDDGQSLCTNAVGTSLLSETKLPGGSLPEPTHDTLELLADVACSQFELTDTIRRVDDGPGFALVSIEGETFADSDYLEYPVSSLLAVGLAKTLDQPVVISERNVDTATDSAEVQLEWMDSTPQVLTDRPE